ncbi:MAG: hypothetical protein KDJ36_06135 [Hyphomicrobiaceae bacterium]|nr:hypothetical protein [Hyphomicrobiaceae bacterium]
MIRIVIENILLFLLPTAIYVIFVMVKQRGEKPRSAQQILDEAPLFWLVGTGALLMIAGLAYFATSTEGKPGQGYAPPVYRDGKIVPGHKE